MNVKAPELKNAFIHANMSTPNAKKDMKLTFAVLLIFIKTRSTIIATDSTAVKISGMFAIVSVYNFYLQLLLLNLNITIEYFSRQEKYHRPIYR
ncbi:MAG: hypothetical protein IKO57_13640 [Treponema sp.]|nr:hypothetical protein [Treponema sp.]